MCRCWCWGWDSGWDSWAKLKNYGLGEGWGAGAGGLGHELRGSLTCLYRKLELCHKHEH